MPVLNLNHGNQALCVWFNKWTSSGTCKLRLVLRELEDNILNKLHEIFGSLE